MPRFALVRRVMIANPSDAAEYVDAARAAVHEWNSEHPMATEILEPVHWTSDTYPSLESTDGQKVVNRQLTDTSDLVVGLFVAKLGSPTPRYPSGTVEEIEEHVKNKRPALVYFCGDPSEAELDPKLVAIRKGYYGRGVVWEVPNVQGFSSALRSHLSRLMEDLGNDKSTRIQVCIDRANDVDLSNEDSHFEFQFTIDDDDVELWCRTFKPNANPAKPMDKWAEHDLFRVDPPDRLKKQDILDRMIRHGHSFKFYLRVPRDSKMQRKYLNRLVNSDATVTGTGDEDTDPNYWRLWFLHSAGFIHPYIGKCYLANHAIADLSGL